MITFSLPECDGRYRWRCAYCEFWKICFERMKREEGWPEWTDTGRSCANDNKPRMAL